MRNLNDFLYYSVDILFNINYLLDCFLNLFYFYLINSFLDNCRYLFDLCNKCSTVYYLTYTSLYLFNFLNDIFYWNYFLTDAWNLLVLDLYMIDNISQYLFSSLDFQNL